MKFSIDTAILNTFPKVEIGVVSVNGMDNRGRNAEILSLLRDEESRQKDLLASVEIGSLPEIAVWRDIYRTFGSNKDYRSSIESLLRRARAGTKPLPEINNLVDLYNYLSLRYHIPAGAEDMDKLVGDVALTFANGTEKGVCLGSEVEEICYPGEVIYRDEVGFICRRWNYREADRTKIEEASTSAVLVMERVPAIPEATFLAALTLGSTLITSHLKGRCTIHRLTVDQPSCVVEKI